MGVKLSFDCTSLENYSMQGIAPADKALLFRQKDPKPFLPVRGPSDPAQKHVLRVFSVSVPNTMAQELAVLKQPSPKKRSIRDRDSAAPNAGKHSGKNQDFKLLEGRANFPKTQYSCLTTIYLRKRTDLAGIWFD